MRFYDKTARGIRVLALRYFVLDRDFHMGKFSHSILRNLVLYSLFFHKGLRHVHIQFRKAASGE